ncbi:sugar ABC transporter substrate-binding protein [Candidatus Viridilinea mediisalina]|uniref:ABC transporter substrate-binding protein n=1 Tax=Candidatus Viridilinea mediisalina TaxID=2024553 RepID=A0A2A6RLC8_9CHLR|nr:extracellular solute-binding protein [Candidatus Viridilinea mediisalina]PDW03668.1 hypothetical protein CJ255_07530 [Candidatus Viridilinea mediisalina]
MKRFVSLMTLMALVALLLAACGGQTPPPVVDVPPTTEPDAPDAETPADADASSEDATPEQPTPAPPTAVPDPVTITIWHNWEGEYYTTIEALFNEYGAANNAEIEFVRVADDMHEALLAAVPDDQGPDIVAWTNDQIGKNVLAMLIQPVNRRGIDDDYLRANFSPVAVNGLSFEAQTWGVPESLQTLTLIYNRDLISTEELPQDTDELIALAREFNTDERYLFVYNGRGDVHASAAWWQGAGVSLVNPNGTTGINSPEGLAAGQLIAELSTIMPQELDATMADTLFREGNAAIILQDLAAVEEYVAAGIDVGLATIPVVSSSGQPGAPFVQVNMLMLAHNAHEPAAAVELMKFYGTPEVQLRLAEVNRQVPANLEAQAQMADDPIIAGFLAQTEQGKPLPNNEFIAAMWESVSQAVEAIWTGSATPEDAIEQAEALFNEKALELR